MSLKHQKTSYQPLGTAAAMDNPAMTQSGSSGGSRSSREGLSETHSSQQLLSSDPNSMEIPSIPIPAAVPSRLTSVGRSQWFTVIVLCFVNLINYMDRFTIAGEFGGPSSSRKIHRIHPSRTISVYPS